MAIRYAVANGNWSNTATWFGGVIPTHGDMAYSNNFTVSIDQNIDIGNEVLTNAGSLVVGQLYVITSLGDTNWVTAGAASNTIGLPFVATTVGAGTGTATTRSCLSNAALASLAITTGGGFTLSSNFTVKASLMGGHASTAALTISNNVSTTITGLVGFTRAAGATLSLTTPGTITVIGDVYGGSTGAGSAITTGSVAVNLIINGNVRPAVISGSRTIAFSATNGSLSVTGSVTGGNLANTTAINASVADGCTITINGNLTGGGNTTSSEALVAGSSSDFNTVIINGNISAPGVEDAVSVVGINSTVTVTGDISSSGAGIGLNFISSASGIINGNIISTSNGHGVAASSSGASGTIVINGNLTGSNSGFGSGLSITTNCTYNITINGTITGGIQGPGLLCSSSGLNITAGTLIAILGPAVSFASGNLTITSDIPARSVRTISGTAVTGANLVINGNVTGPTTAVPAIDFASGTSAAITLTVNGNVTGGSVPGAYGITGAGTNNNNIITINGNVNATTNAHAIRSVTTALESAVIVNGNVNNAINGVAAIIAPRWYFGSSPQTRSLIVSNNAVSTYTYYGENIWNASFPITANVRSGTSYGVGGIYTGTCAVPNSNNVALGVPVDNTVGTSSSDPVTIAGAVRTELATELARIDANVSSAGGGATAGDIADAVRLELAPELAYVDAAVSSRLATTSYAAPDTAATVATAVRSELGVELARMDAAVTTRLASANYDAPIAATTIAGAVRTELATELARIDIAVSDATTDVSGIPGAVRTELATELAFIDAPISTVGGGDNAATVATAVRTELATELARIDAAVSSRLATAGYTAPDTTAAVASAVRNELATELARIDTAVSTRLATTDYISPETKEAIAVAVEAALLNEGDGQQLIDAILQVINTNLDLPALELTAIANAVRSELATELARIDANVSTAGDPVTIAGAVRTELATELARVDAAVSTRLASAGYTSPPAAATVAGAVRTELAVELARIDIPISEGTEAHEGDIALAVRAELATELARIDIPISDATTDISGIPADVRAELAPELERIANCSTVDTTGAQLAALL